MPSTQMADGGGSGSNEYGYSTSAVESYLEDIHSSALQAAKDAVNEASVVENAVSNNWEGKAKDDWLEIFAKDRQHVCDQLDNLYAVLRSEINSLNSAMAQKDNTMMKELL